MMRRLSIRVPATMAPTTQTSLLSAMRHPLVEECVDGQPSVMACVKAGKWNEMQFFIGKCTSETDLEKLKELKGRTVRDGRLWISISRSAE